MKVSQTGDAENLKQSRRNLYQYENEKYRKRPAYRTSNKQ